MHKATFQIYSDINTKVVPGYVDGKSLSKPAKVSTEKVENVMGSCAGAGSGEFHMYLNSRNREQSRLQEIDESKRVTEEERIFCEKVAKNKMINEERTKRNSEKRKKMKCRKELNRKKAKLNKQTTASEDSDNAGDSEEEQESS